MCGIAGYFGFDLPDRSRFHHAAMVLRHRGPDGKGIYTHRFRDQAIALVHRRLAIIDLDLRSDQPFRLRDQVLVFNGEIYNYLELRHDLQSLGHRFVTAGDTEVLAHALQEWGESALDRLEGMWAFAWYSESSGKLLLSRDLFGEKPLYLWYRDGGLYFASEVKGLAALAGEWPAVNQNHLIRYLVNGYKSLYKTQETFYQDVFELPPAHCLNLGPKGSGEPKPYWLPPLQESGDMTYDEAVDRTRESFIRSLRLRIRSDVPLAFCMSGGVDSNSLISTACRRLGCEVHGFTIVNTDARYEEQSLVDQSVKELGIRHTSVRLQQRGFLENLFKLVEAHDGPVSTISYYTHWQLMQAIKSEDYKVTISGTGADELFTGYYDHHNLYLYEVSNDPEWHQHSLSNWKEYQSGLVRNPYLKDPDLYLKDRNFRKHIYLNNDVYSSWLRTPWHESFVEDDYNTGLLRNRMLNELFTEAVPVILHEDDHNAMYYSLENRSPFLDRKLFETAYSIPSRYLIQNGYGKAILRDAMRDIVPDAILDSRRKVGFNAPIEDLVDITNSDFSSYLLDDSPIYEIVRREKIEELLKSDRLPNSDSKYLFSFANAKIFLAQNEERQC